MPEVSGFDILAEVRGHEELRYTPVIILTAESDPTAKLKALELGATDLLTKPVDPERAAPAAAQRARVQGLPGPPGGLRPADRAAQPQEVPRRSGGSAGAQRRDVVARLRAAAHRPGPLQAGERLARASRRRPAAVRGRQGPGNGVRLVQAVATDRRATARGGVLPHRRQRLRGAAARSAQPDQGRRCHRHGAGASRTRCPSPSRWTGTSCA